MQCPKCGKFVGNITAWVNGLDEITKVEGDCKVHGTVDVTDQDWCYEQFFPPEEA